MILPTKNGWHITHIPVPSIQDVRSMSFWSSQDQTQLVKVLCPTCRGQFVELLSAVEEAIGEARYRFLICISCDPEADK